MALTYPLSTPTTIGIESIELRAVNAVAVSQSPFTYKQQVISHGGQKWEASVNIPSVHRDKAAQWKAMLVGLKGQVGTFLLGDPDYATPQGTVSSCTLTGSVGDDTVNVVMTGTLKAGDYIQLGSGSSAKLHQVLLDQDGDGDLEIWPSLRSDYTDATVTFDNPKGVFRLSNNVTSWSINNASIYGISFEAVEALT
ncbi:hypothetical protein N9796_00380 [bacterium]|nr:hypothetical protein [bacterium]MDB4352543.1 hypothetical protein [Porticoccaceae bacterium]